MNRVRLVVAAAAAGPALALAQAGPAVEPAISPAGSLLQVFIGLVFVLLLIVATGWAARRFGLARAGGTALLHVVGSVSVGTRERVAVVEIGDTWLVVGVAPGSVNALATLPRGEAPAAALAPVALGTLSPFREKLQQMIDTRREK
ncbi:MAG: flagellar biosynthetic protein FliO [Pseudomonadota bacterium]|jgi:flagellar protein FliO/FliZ